MFIIELTYIKPFDNVNRLLEQHRNFLDKYYSAGIFIASGAKEPRNGGIIIAVTDTVTIRELIKEDPFYQNKIADYSITEFIPSKCCGELRSLLGLS